MDTLKPKNSKSITSTVKGGFLTFWAILAHSVPWRPRGTVDENEEFWGIYIFVPWE